MSRYTYYGYSNCARNRSQVKFKQVQTILTWHDQLPLNRFHPKASRQMGQRVSASWTAGPTSMYSIKSTSSPDGALRVMGRPPGLKPWCNVLPFWAPVYFGSIMDLIETTIQDFIVLNHQSNILKQLL